jgi:hypothetical protein
MTQGLTNPITGKTYIFKGLTPLRRVAESCRHGSHDSCKSAPQDLISVFGFEYTKKVCCLCQCHFEGEVQI